MAMRKTKPTSPGRRFATYQKREEVTATKPHKPLTKGKRKSGGRNSHGRVTSRHRGGGAKRRYREIDFKRRKDGVPAKVATIEYDPNRTCYIALLHYADGAKSYILAPQGLAARRHGRVRREGRHPARQRAAAARDPDRHRGPQRRAGPRPGRPARPLGGLGDPGGREGGPDGHPAPALLGDADGARRVPRDRRLRSPTPSTRTSRSARRGATATRASARRPAASR